MDAETQAFEAARTELNGMLGSASPEKAALIHKALGLLPSPHRGMRPEPDPFTEDKKLGLTNPAVKSPATLAENFSTDPAYDNSPVGQRKRDEDAVNPPLPAKTELEGDPSLQEIVGQAGGGALMHGIGMLLAKPAQALLRSRGGQAAEYLRSRGLPFSEPFRPFEGPEPEVPSAKVEGGSFFSGEKTEDAIAKLESIKAKATPEAAKDIDAEISRLRSASSATSADPEVMRARGILHLRDPHVGMHGVQLPHSAIPAILGRLTVPAKIADATGTGIASAALPSSFLSSPLMQAVFADKPYPLVESPALPAGRTK